MAYVIPDSAIFLLKNVPLDVEHKHTWYFDNYQTQFDHFYNHYFTDTTLQIRDSQYIRYEDGAIKVPFPISKCIDCNYMIFGNTSFEQRWFYAFITNVEYVSNDVTKIYYEIDELQTWMCFFTLEQCFIERQHQVTDVVGDNLIPEGLETGEYVVDWMAMPAQLAQHSIVAATTLDHLGQTIPGRIYNRVYGGAGYTVFSADQQGVNEINSFLSNIQASGNNTAIVSIFMCPTFLLGEPDYFYSYINKPTSLNGYTPRNKKLLTYPYTYAYVTNMQGISATYPFEYFSTETAQFKITGALACAPELMAYPINYKGQPGNIDEAIRVGGFPQCSYATDSFKAWVAQQVGPVANAAIALAADTSQSANIFDVGGFQNRYQNPTNPLIGGLQRIGKFFQVTKDTIKNPFNSMTTAPTNDDDGVIDTLKAVVQRYIKPPQCVGGSNASSLFANNSLGFVFAVKNITYQFASIIDDFFDRYGYKIHRLAVPNMHARKGWTYINTKNCVVNGNLPASSASFIENCFNAGITFWNPNYIMGDYTQDNSPGGI